MTRRRYFFPFNLIDFYRAFHSGHCHKAALHKYINSGYKHKFIHEFYIPYKQARDIGGKQKVLERTRRRNVRRNQTNKSIDFFVYKMKVYSK